MLSGQAVPEATSPGAISLVAARSSCRSESGTSSRTPELLTALSHRHWPAWRAEGRKRVEDQLAKCCAPFDQLRAVGCACDTGMRAVLEGILLNTDVASALQQCPGKTAESIKLVCSTSAYPAGWNVEQPDNDMAYDFDDMEIDYIDSDTAGYYGEYDSDDTAVDNGFDEASSRYSGEYEVREGQTIMGEDAGFVPEGVDVASLVSKLATAAALAGAGENASNGDITVDVYVDVTPAQPSGDAADREVSLGQLAEEESGSGSNVDITYEISGSGAQFYDTVTQVVSWIAKLAPSIASASQEVDRMDQTDDMMDRVSALVAEVTASLGGILGSAGTDLDVDIEYEIDIEDSNLNGEFGDIQIDIDPIATDGTPLTLAQQIEAMKGALAAAQPLLAARPDFDWDTTLDIPVSADITTGSAGSAGGATLAVPSLLQPQAEATQAPPCWRMALRNWLCQHRGAVKTALGFEIGLLVTLVVGSFLYSRMRSRCARQPSVEEESLEAPLLLVEDASQYAHPQGSIVSPLWSHMMTNKDTQTV
ncbi:hypothetical protein WJX72_009722 [[Myrmecia] bisecta]|uniref:Uncharacterized protein n=1 Tax=[Myrmecia] bisecta TaxID=41462 RepID=A0AAW1PF30_9CHLO